MTRRSDARRPTAAATLLAIVAAVLAAPAQPATAQPAPPRAAGIAWAPCPDEVISTVAEDERDLYSCGSFPVPLDHARPGGETIVIKLVRRAAADPDRRIGPLFAAFGGPGLSGAFVSVNAPHLFQDDVLDRFDVIGLVPRGSLLHCFDSGEHEADVRGRMASVPVTGDEVSSALAARAEYAEACGNNGGELIEHLSTANAARDLDLLRAAQGEERITLLAISYGTLIGATYVNLYPQHVRAAVLVSPVDAELRTTRPLAYDRQRAQGTEDALDRLLRECAEAGEACSFGEGDPHAKFDRVRDRLREGPLELGGGDVATLESLTGMATYMVVRFSGMDPTPIDTFFAHLQAIYDAVEREGAGVDAAALEAAPTPSPAVSPAGAAARTGGAGDAADYADNADSFYGTNCADRPYPRTPGVVPRLADRWEKEAPTFGRAQAFEQLPVCALWPVRPTDAYHGPWDTETDAPVVVLGNHFDGPTPFTFAERMADRLGDGRLIGVADFGHLPLGTSECADDAVTAYLTSLEVPDEEGLTCAPDAGLW